MRRWFAISGICHAGILLGLTIWLYEPAAPPRVRAHVFACVEVSESSQELEPRVVGAGA